VDNVPDDRSAVDLGAGNGNATGKGRNKKNSLQWQSSRKWNLGDIDEYTEKRKRG